MLMTPDYTKPKKKKIVTLFPRKLSDRLEDMSHKLEKPQSQIILDAVREHLTRLEETDRK